MRLCDVKGVKKEEESGDQKVLLYFAQLAHNGPTKACNNAKRQDGMIHGHDGMGVTTM